MSLKFKFISVFASGLLLGSFAITASAQETVQPSKDGVEKAEKHEGKGFGRRGQHGKGPGGEFRGMRGLMGIELTEAQKAQIKQIHEANRPDPAVMEEMKAIHEARRNGGTLTEDQKTRMKALRDQARAKGESVNQQVLAILTPEQRQQLETRKAEMQKKMQERRQQMQEQRKELKTQKIATPDKSSDN
ncbi:MAG: hypothetical protein HOP17_11115 [Acidobacteria bacterium]|nr:hypothetical protein [Acidobacteriota bacterium]